MAQSAAPIDKVAASTNMAGVDFRQVLARAKEYFDKGDLTNALLLCEQALDIPGVSLGLGAPGRARLLYTIGDTYAKWGDYTNVLHSLEQALAIPEASTALGASELARLLCIVGSTYANWGDGSKALPLLGRGLRIVESEPGGTNNVEMLPAFLLAIGVAQKSQERFDQAIRTFERCLAIQLTARDPATNASMKALADLYSTTGNFAKALSMYSQLLVAKEIAFGSENPEVGVIWNNMAMVYETKGDFARALPIYQHALALRVKAYGPDNAGVATILNNVARMLFLESDYEGAVLACRRGLEIRQRALGMEHPDVVTSLMTLALFYQSLGNRDEAIRLFQRCLDIEKRLSVKDDRQLATLLSALAFCQSEQGNYEQALDLVRRAVSIDEKLFGMEHPNVASRLASLASVYQAKGETKEAWRLLVRSLNMRTNAFGGDDPAVIRTMHDLALLDADQNELARSLHGFRLAFRLERGYLCNQLIASSEAQGLRLSQALFARGAILHSLCGLAASTILSEAGIVGAEQLAICKALLEEVQATRAALEADPRTETQDLSSRYRAVHTELSRLSESRLETPMRETKRRELEAELRRLAAKVGERLALVEQTVKDWNSTLTNVAESLQEATVFVDCVGYRRYDFAAKTNKWKESRYAAYLTFPLAKGSPNLIVKRVDLGEAAPINEAVELVCKRMSAGQFAAKDLSAALQRLGQLVYAPLAPHLTNVSHLIVCPDGQLNRLPFEMLPVGSKFLVEEKTISYVTSGREVARIASLKSKGQGLKSAEGGSKSLVMGNPDFDFPLPGSSRRESAPTESSQPSTNSSQPEVQSQLTLAATRAMSRSFTGMKFLPLPGSGMEATNVAKLLGEEATLRLGPAAREAELKAVKSPRVLHLATHGFFLSDQEVNRETRGRREMPLAFSGSGVAADPFSRGMRGPRFDDWENPLMRCGIALAGANHFTNSLARSSRGDEALAKKSKIEVSLLTSAATRIEEEDGLLTGLEAALLNLQGTELVILSACDSGTGEVKIGEGVMSLRRAFRIAGAETVLASHWKVSDKATSQLMTEFMHRWRAGEPRAKAWREAQLSLLGSKEFSNPYFWAAFTLTGQWN